jgi:hypothetical protein
MHNKKKKKIERLQASLKRQYVKKIVLHINLKSDMIQLYFIKKTTHFLANLDCFQKKKWKIRKDTVLGGIKYNQIHHYLIDWFEKIHPFFNMLVIHLTPFVAKKVLV